MDVNVSALSTHNRRNAISGLKTTLVVVVAPGATIALLVAAVIVLVGSV